MSVYFVYLYWAARRLRCEEREIRKWLQRLLVQREISVIAVLFTFFTFCREHLQWTEHNSFAPGYCGLGFWFSIIHESLLIVRVASSGFEAPDNPFCFYRECSGPSLQLSPHRFCIWSRYLVHQPLVLIYSSLLGESLTTDIALIGSDASMLPFMRYQTLLGLEHFTARSTSKRWFLVFYHVSFQLFLWTWIITEITLDNLTVSIWYMASKCMPMHKFFTTFVTKKWAALIFFRFMLL